MSGLIYIWRDDPRPGWGQFGRLFFNGIFIGYTVEREWLDNKVGVSCIPCGSYELHQHSSAKHPATVAFHQPSLNVYAELTQVPAGVDGARTEALIHPANWPMQLEGCVAPGKAVAYFGPGYGVTDSDATFIRLASLWGDRTGLSAIISRSPPQ